MTLRLLCQANPMAYGSTTAMLAITHHLQRAGVHLCAPGQGVICELLESAPSIDEVLDIDPRDPAALAQSVASRQFDAALVVSNRTCLEVLLDAGLPVFFIDILFWYGRDDEHRIWREAEACFAEAFPANKPRLDRFAQAGIRPRVVGPLIRTDLLKDAGGPPSCEILVNLGGGENRWIQPGDNSCFPALIAGLLRRLRSSLPPGRVLIAAGRRLAHVLEREQLPEDVEVRTLPHHEYLSVLAGCELLLTTPGLNAIFEALHANKPMIMLLPQNASQVEQFQVYEQSGLAPAGINLPTLVPGMPAAGACVGEGEMTDAVLRALDKVNSSEEIQDVAAHHILNQIQEACSGELQRNKQRFADALGAPGAEQVACAIQDWARGGGA